MTLPTSAAQRSSKKRALVICAHLRPSRDKRRSSYLMQPISGLQVASLINSAEFEVKLYHEDWHGPWNTTLDAPYDLVFLSGLQVDFDRMRQLSYHFRRNGAKTVAGGSICTSFPEYATSFFDAVCAGGVDSVPEVVNDFMAGRLQPIYRSKVLNISSYVVDYSLMRAAGINPSVHLIEASRGCSFKCSFCVMPSEVGGYASYRLADVAASIDRAIATSPRFGFRRNYPLILFLDNNLSDDRAYLMAVCKMMKDHAKVRGWSALVTQNLLHDRDLVEHLAASKCVGLFVGLESLDTAMLKRFRKTQNLSRRFNILQDIAFAEAQGIGIAYGMLFDPRHQTAVEMRRQLVAIAEDPLMPMPVYLSMIAPLAATQSFWEDLVAHHLEPGLRLRDLDGETICYTGLADSREAIAAFGAQVFRRPWEVVGRTRILMKTLRRVLRSGTWDPVRWFIISAANLHCYLWSKGTPSGERTYVVGTDPLDPQYTEFPADLSVEDRVRYFDPIVLVDDLGEPADWLRPYIPIVAHSGARRALPQAAG